MRVATVSGICRRGLATLLVGGGLLGLVDGSRASESVWTVGRSSMVAGGYTLLLNPVDGIPAALLDDPFHLMVPERRLAALRGVAEVAATTGLPVLRVTCVLPEFWAEPAAWGHFRAGPDAYSGEGRAVGIKDWAGRPETDRRAYALDNGLPPRMTAQSFPPLGGGQLTLVRGAASLLISWRGGEGRVYALEFTGDLATPFRAVSTFIQAEDGEVTLSVSPEDGEAGYYRVSEQLP